MSAQNTLPITDLMASITDLQTSISMDTSLPPPNQLPDLLQTIDNIGKSLLETDKLDEVHSLTEEMLNYVKILTDGYGKSYESSKTTTGVALPVFNSPNQDEILGNTGEQLGDAIQNMDQIIREDLPIDDNSGITVIPNYLPEIQELSINFSELRNKLKKVMTEAEDPDYPLTIEELKKAFDEHHYDYELLSLQQQNINSPLTEKTQNLDDHVETTRQQKANVLIAKEDCEWHLKRADMYTNIYKPLKALQEEIGAIHRSNESIKDYLNKHSYDKFDRIKTKFELIFMGVQTKPISEIEPEIISLIEILADQQIKNDLLDILQTNPNTPVADAKPIMLEALAQLPRSIVDQPLQDYRSVISRFNKCKNSAGSLMVNVEKTMTKLNTLIENNGKELTEIINTIPLHYETVKNGVEMHLEQTNKDMKTEKIEIKTMIENCWDQIIENLTLRVKNLTYNEIYRVGNWMLDNNGKAPYDSTKNWYGLGWNISVDYVTPFNPTNYNE